ncbi:putative cytochrome P450 6a17 [Chionoecetes opilio]|uniref:Putative cytochrome P450 6a17 n=1 Tax=Chionoecetes opilio TaxID=41210 RepID=A0A8J4XU73_CHIOP|nr:putative cytochrome P450 6a17 [Chionoecetes opilio]
MNTSHERDQTVMEMLSVKNGEGWKALRAIMTPTFTSGKIKNMFPLVCDKADALVKFSMKEAAEKPYVDIKKNFGRYTMDTIASCAFGIECNSLVDEKAEFPRKAEAFFNVSYTSVAKMMLAIFAPKLIKLFRLSINATETDFFIEVVKQTVAAREAREAGPRRGDFLDLLMEARDNADNPDTKHVLSDRSLVAQSVLFIIAGYETTANLLAFSTYLLAKNKDQQRRLRDELQKIVAEKGDITYQGIMEAKLLDACLQGESRDSTYGSITRFTPTWLLH